MAEKEFTGDVKSGTRMPVYAKWTGGMVQAVFIDGNLNAVRYRDEILRPVVLPLLERIEVMMCSSMMTPVLLWLVYAPIS